jgi:hypothetical protein
VLYSHFQGSFLWLQMSVFTQAGRGTETLTNNSQMVIYLVQIVDLTMHKQFQWVRIEH